MKVEISRRGIDISIFNLRVVCYKPESAMHFWVFVEWDRVIGLYSYKLELSNAFWGWRVRFINCGDGSLPFGVRSYQGW